MIWLAIILFLLAIAANIILDHRRILKKKYINHAKEERWIIKGLSLIPCVVLFVLAIDNVAWHARIIVTILFVAFWFWLIFDGLIGLLLKKGFFYAGSDWHGKAKTDAALQELPIWARAVIKIGACIMFTYIYYVMYQK